jgi:hypothetical protein
MERLGDWGTGRLGARQKIYFNRSIPSKIVEKRQKKGKVREAGG